VERSSEGSHEYWLDIIAFLVMFSQNNQKSLTFYFQNGLLKESTWGTSLTLVGVNVKGHF
jgi:hypothetical protein